MSPLPITFLLIPLSLGAVGSCGSIATQKQGLPKKVQQPANAKPSSPKPRTPKPRPTTKPRPPHSRPARPTTKPAPVSPVVVKAHKKRPSDWAVPLKGIPGLPNLFRVSNSLYRSAQPTREGFRQAKKLGIKTIVNLRILHSDRHLLRGTGLDYVHISIKPWHPEDEDLVRFLRIVTNPSRQPVLVHCNQGSDRSGVMTAAYRILVQGWNKEKAIHEMLQGGFGFHRKLWPNLIRYLRNLDVSKIKKQAGLEKK